MRIDSVHRTARAKRLDRDWIKTPDNAELFDDELRRRTAQRAAACMPNTGANSPDPIDSIRHQYSNLITDIEDMCTAAKLMTAKPPAKRD